MSLMLVRDKDDPLDIDWFMDKYLSADADQTDPRASPALHPNLAGLPACFITTWVPRTAMSLISSLLARKTTRRNNGASAL